MKRREFLRTSAGFVAVALAPGVWAVDRPRRKPQTCDFAPYRAGKTVGEVTKVTPDDGIYIQTFYDICPFSPSERFLAVTRFPFQDREPRRGETAEVCVVDLEKRSIETVYKTKAWCTQLGANLNWGKTDRHLYTNDIVDDRGVCVQIDLESGKARAFDGPMYHVAPDESCVIGHPPELLNRTQRGYGIPDHPDKPRSLPPGAAKEEGLWRTDLKSGEKTLLVSLADAAKHISNPAAFEGGTFYFFHSKFNKQNTRIMEVMRVVWPKKRKRSAIMLLTFNVDGSDIREAISWDQWSSGGHHPNWHPDGEHLVMNLRPKKRLSFVQFRYDGADFRTIAGSRQGSGHPSVDRSGKYLITDTYTGNKTFVKEDKEVPIRLINLETDEEREVCRMCTLGLDRRHYQTVLRIDAHPAWSRDYKKVCFNGSSDGKKQVFIADLSEVL